MENVREAVVGCLEARRANNMTLTIAVHEIEFGVSDLLTKDVELLEELT